MVKYYLKDAQHNILKKGMTDTPYIFNNLSLARAYGIYAINGNPKLGVISVYKMLKNQNVLVGMLYFDRNTAGYRGLGWCWLQGMEEYAQHVRPVSGTVTNFTDERDLRKAKKVNDKLPYLW